MDLAVYFRRLKFKDDINLRKMAFASVLLPMVVWFSQPLIGQAIRAPEVLILAGVIQLGLIVGALYCGLGVVVRGRHEVAPLDWWLAVAGVVLAGLTVLILLGAIGLLFVLRVA